jgi:hypothetical protein
VILPEVFALRTVFAPAQKLVFPLMDTVGAAATAIACVAVLEPPPLLDVSVAVYVPADG